MSKILDNLVNSAIRDENFHTSEFPDAYGQVKEALERLETLFNSYGQQCFENGEAHGAGYSHDWETAKDIKDEFLQVLRSL